MAPVLLWVIQTQPAQKGLSEGAVSTQGSAWCSQNLGEAKAVENVLGRGWAIVDDWLWGGQCG